MKKVLLLGDSIRLNYMPKVFRNLFGIAEVVGPEENCRFAKYVITNLEAWLEKFGTPDVVHWNNGIWEVHRFIDDDVLVPLDEYLRDLDRIYARLKKTGAKIIFATSTPCNPKYTEVSNLNIDRYNKAAVELLMNKVDEINDLNAFVKPHIEEYICDDLLHLNKDGISAVGDRVTEVVKKYL